MKKRILVTGAEGYVGKKLIRKLIENPENIETLVGIDIKNSSDYNKENYHFIQCDILSETPDQLIEKYQINTIVHLASIVKAPKGMKRETMYEIDVLGTKKLYESAIKNEVDQIIITTSGASYGYYKDNPKWLKETDAIRGNDEFAYSQHKRLIEEMLLGYREKSDLPKQLILRPGTILGKGVSNQITDIFERAVVTGIKNAKTPFVFIWDEDVVNIIFQGIFESKSGIFNLAGDGYVTLPEIAGILKKPFIGMPVSFMKAVLGFLKKINLTQYGPEQVRFLLYRPVLANEKLKSEFKYTPTYSSKEVFEFYLKDDPGDRN
ncbi:MAG: NAD-dependent epimerase/dehydratase family protein [Bacteroidota bacterium]